jgi:preprotein translocase subunit SecB
MINIQSSLSSQAPEFTIQRIYVKDLSLESPQEPLVFQGEWKPEVNLEFATEINRIDTDTYKLVLYIQVKATSGEKALEKILFLVEIKQAGLFTLKGFTEEQNQQILSITCPTILFPYAREAVSDLVGRAGFPSLYLAPVNFEALYAQQLQKQGEEGGSGTKKANSQNSIINH